MADLPSFLFVLALLYISECICRISPRAIVFMSWLGGPLSVWSPFTYPGNGRWAWFISTPLPPLGPVYVVHEPTVTFLAERALVKDHPNERLRSGIKYSEIHSVSCEHSEVFLNTDLVINCVSQLEAISVSSTLSRLSSRSPADREAFLRARMIDSFDQKKIRSRVEQYQSATFLIRFLCNLLFLVLFVFWPLTTFRYTLDRTLIALAIVVFVFGLCISIVTVFTHRTLYPDLPHDLFLAIRLALYPIGAVRANDYMARDLLNSFDPVALASVLASPSVVKRLARRALVRLRLAIAQHPAPIESGFAEYCVDQLDCLTTFLNRQNVDPLELGLRPMPSDASCRSFCPQCGAQYRMSAGCCGDCVGVELVPFVLKGEEVTDERSIHL
jgi:hypothetical protein